MKHIQRVLFRLEFDGSFFLGWQFQDPNRSGNSGKEPIQNLLERALQTVLRCPDRIPIQGCGRTDTGVHAEEFYAHADLESSWIEKSGGLEKIRHHLNGIFREGLGVTHLSEVAPTFHALHSIQSKTYEYRILIRRSPSPLLAQRVLWLPILDSDFSIDVLQKALDLCQGKHDFSAFASAGSETKSTVRTLFECSTTAEMPFGNTKSGKLIKIQYTGDGFLKQMVRNLSGTLIEIAQGKRSLENLEKLLNPTENKLSRQDAGFCADPCGLYLKKLHYSEEMV